VKPRTYLTLLIIPAILSLAVPSAKADDVVTTMWVTASGATVTGSPVDDLVTLAIDYTTDEITITPLNLETDLTRDFQMISHIDMTLSGLISGTTSSVVSSSFNMINVSKTATSSDNSPTPANVWRALLTAGGSLSFCTNCNGGGNQELIIGGPKTDPADLYPDGNSGLYAKSPLILGSGGSYTGVLAGLDSNPSWVISVPEIDHNTAVAPTAVTFGFGTAGGLTAGGQEQQPPSTPEPATVTELIAGGALLLAVGWKRRNQAQR
jgi:hypothetical protein